MISEYESNNKLTSITLQIHNVSEVYYKAAY